MDLKKIMALAMLALMVIPSMTITVGAVEEDGIGLASAIERARLYLDNVRNSATDLATEHKDNEDIQGYLIQIYALLGQYDYEGPDFLLEWGTYGVAERSDDQSHSGTYSVHLKTTGTPGDGDEARIVIPMPEGFTLGDIETISWWTFLVSGYIPHVDIFTPVEILNAEGAHVNENGITGWSTETWFSTFDGASGVYTTGRGIEGSCADVTTVNSESAVWFCADDATVLYTLGQFQTPDLVQGMNESTLVTKIEIEVDNWIPEAWGGVNAEAYVDDIKIDEVIYDFEEEPEDLGAEGFLVQASAYLAEDDIKSAARSLASARNILGRVKGLLTSMIKVDKVARTERFVQQFEHRIAGLEDKIHRLRGRFGEGKANKAKASMGLALGRLGQLGADVSVGNVDMTLDGLCDIIEDINTAIADLDGDTSDIVEAMDRLEAKIRVLNATANRLSRKGCDTTDVVDELNKADELLQGILASLQEGDTEEAANLLKQAANLVSEASSELRGISKGHRYKGTKKDK